MDNCDAAATLQYMARTRTPPTEPAEPADDDLTETVAFRVSKRLLDAVNAEVRRQKAENPGRSVRPSDVMREALHRQLLAPTRPRRP